MKYDNVLKCDTKELDIYIAIGDLTLDDVYDVIQEYVDEVGYCVNVSETMYVYSGGRERGVKIGLINYPRFADRSPSYNSLTYNAKRIASLIAEAAQQDSYSFVYPSQTVMYFNEKKLKEIEEFS